MRYAAVAAGRERRSVRISLQPSDQALQVICESGFAAGDGIVNRGTVNVSGSLVIKGDAVTNAGAIGSSGSLDIEFGSAFTNDLGGAISAASVYRSSAPIAFKTRG
jgi:hypothetical protein